MAKRAALGSRPSFASRVDTDPRCGSLAGVRGHFLFEFLFQRLQVEARTLLHWREFKRGLSELPHYLLNEHEAPELVDEPILVEDGSTGPAGHPGALEWIETQVD